jgi:hypothetical protein
MRRYGLLTIWLLGILFPLAWLGQYWAFFRQVFDPAFAPEVVHILMHLILFAGLIVIGFWTFRVSLNRKTIFASLALVLVIGVLQEVLQAWSNGIFLLPALVFDLGVDLVGGAVGLVIVSSRRLRQGGA